MAIPKRVQGFLLSVAMIVPLVGVPATAANATSQLQQPETAATAAAPAAETTAKGVVINEAYLSGGSAGAAYKNKFVELYNATDKDVTLDGTSLQYRSATGEGAANFTAPLKGTIKAKGYYLVKAGSNGKNGADLPAADVEATGLNVSGTKGTLFLAATTDKLSPAIGDTTANAQIIDALGYGSTNTFEKAAATAPKGNTDVKSLNRTNGVDTNDNSKDFTLSATITPESSGSTGSKPDPDPQPNPDVCSVADKDGNATIAQIQGTGDASPCVNKTVTTKGVVTATYPDGGFGGFTIQTPATGGDVDPAKRTASDGLFVYDADTAKTLKAGDYVEVSGKVSEYYGLTELSATKATKLADKVEAPAPAKVAFPKTDAQRETLESMLVAPQGDYTVSDVYNTNKYGEIGLAASDKPFLNPTVKGLKGDVKTGAAYQAELDRLEAESVTLDDGSSYNFLDTKHPTNADTPLPYLSNDQPVRVGEKVTFTKPVVLDWRNNAWKFQPTTRLTGDNADAQPATFANTRTSTPDLASVGGDVKLGTFNVLNYFSTTADQTGCAANNAYTDRDGNPITARNCDVRGAWNQENMERQRTKIVKAINNLGADVVSLEEIENSAKPASKVPETFKGNRRDYALSTLVDALNAEAGAGTWAYVPSPKDVPALDVEDVIRTAFIYKPAKVATVGETRILTDSDAFNGVAPYEHGRQPDAQAFKAKDADDSSAFLVVANHFKSKGSASNEQNQDPGDGSGNADFTRQAQADALLKFTDAVKTDLKLQKVFLVGDFNAYYAERPIQKIVAAGYTDLSEQVSEKTGKYTYSYTVEDDKGNSNGGVGSLDHIFANEAALKDVTGADIWNINSVESVALEYSRYNYNAKNLYKADQFRASDHDPVVVGIKAQGENPNPPTPPAFEDTIKDPATAVFLKRIDVGKDTVTLGSKNTKDVDLSGWSFRDDKDSEDHIYTVPDGTVLKAGGELSFNLDELAKIGLGKSDQVRVFGKDGKQLLQFTWKDQDKNVVFVANTDADGMVIEGENPNPNPPSGESMPVNPWPGLKAVTPIDGVDEFGAGQATGEHTDDNLSGLAYQPGVNGRPGTLWAADNDLNPTLGITGPKGAGSINKFVYDPATNSWKQDPSNGWSFVKDGKLKGGKQLHFKDGEGGVDSEGIALIGGDPSKGVFIGAERDNTDKNKPRPSILRYDVSAKTTDANGDGAQDLTAVDEWNLQQPLDSAFGVQLEGKDDANLGVEGVAFIPDATLTAKGFKTKDGKLYNPADYRNSFGGLFFAALEKTNGIYAFALSNEDGKDTVEAVAEVDLPQTAANAGYSGPRDLVWDGEHSQLLAQGDNTIGAEETSTKAMIATYVFKEGALELNTLTATPNEIASGNTEGFAITPDAEAKTVERGENGKTYKPVFWADDAVTDGHSLRMGYIEATAPVIPNPPTPEPEPLPQPGPSKSLATITGVNPANAWFDGKAHAGYSGTPTSEYTGEYAISYAGVDGTAYGPTAEAPVAAGNYSVTIAVPASDPNWYGSVTLRFAIQDGSVAIRRFFNPYSGLHMWTASKDETTTLKGSGWNDEGNGLTMDAQTGDPIFRLYNRFNGQHLWTINELEKNGLLTVGWTYEGVAFRQNPSATVDVFRLYNPYSGEHLWTTATVERNTLVANGWNDEGVAWKASKAD
ncbi:ExeM/NucH family extracellular endonuclease [Bifidobacterium vespertilionis]|uniref:ExeM/NucH family extracellular endonuclease n=1 Tax=Bifidobacterium vespertilionis TaxID=2562524 RepID=A0A5J5DZW1_9BIFI|nr:ExeM/NucH family extracellular endonuclease [Bifidobacterium vespertilionis]KAA8822457.1 ExeM/NucH family extracellular endonuclease [Bifidobacterium vespertilionis]KAA8824481.1 ExeM/NucH family extracellular endonuclease [Bifidobacterium vespertilionis]